MKENCLNYKDLISEGKLKKEPNIGFDQIIRLLNRAKKDISTSSSLIDTDCGVALAALYSGMFHAGNALIRSQGYRPGTIKQHVGVIEAVNRTLGEDVKGLILKFDNLRKQRNKFEYQGELEITETLLKNRIKDAEKLLEIIEQYIQEQNPQLKLEI